MNPYYICRYDAFLCLATNTPNSERSIFVNADTKESPMQAHFLNTFTCASFDIKSEENSPYDASCGPFFQRLL